jgi:serine/threonine-protein kinase
MTDWKSVLESHLAENSDSVEAPEIKLPILPKALLEFREESQNPDANISKLTRIVSADAGLSAELLKNVNIAMASTLTKITSVQQALVFLGIAKTRMYLTVSGMKQIMKSSSSKLINFQTFWNANLERALFAREVARLIGADPDIAYTASMLQDFLLPLITNQRYEDYIDFSSNRDQYTNLIKFEKEKFGWDHAQVAGHILNSWNFPGEMVSCIYFHHRGADVLKDNSLCNTSVAAVAIATMIPEAFRQESNSLEALMELDKVWPGFRLMALAQKIDDEFQRVAGQPKNHFPLIHVLKSRMEKMAAQA